MKQALVEDENSIKKYFEMYAKADFDDEDTRNQVLEYFVDKIYVYNDRLVITWYYSDDKTSIDLDALTEITETSESKGFDIATVRSIYFSAICTAIAPSATAVTI